MTATGILPGDVPHELGQQLYRYTNWTEEDSAVILDYIDRGADLATVDDIGCTMLMNACFRSTHNTVKILLEHGVDVNARTKYDFNALFYAQNARMVETLIDAGIDVHIVSHLGETPLIHYAVFHMADAMKAVLKTSIDTIDNQDKEGRTALIHTADMASLECINLLLDYGANPNLKNDRGQTARMKVEIATSVEFSTHDPRGRYRGYTRAEVEGLIERLKQAEKAAHDQAARPILNAHALPAKRLRLTVRRPGA